MQTMKDYKADLNQRYWEYQKSPQFSIFERPYADDGRPPVFIRSEGAWQNVIVNPDMSEASEQKKEKLFDLIPKGEWHKWFGSMNSSQALAQSVLGNLFVYGSLHYLSELKDDEGMDLFGEAKISSDNFEMEYKINYLGEPRRTSLDGYISGDYRVAIECKFTEPEVGPCSHTRSNSKDSKPPCNGAYSMQGGKERCLLTEKKIKYWQYVPQLFKWKSDSDIDPCPLKLNYQLVRNILAVGVKPNGTVSLIDGHVLLIYDERNPAFKPDGDGFNAYTKTREALQKPTMLRKCSWQRIVKHIREKNTLSWLTESLDQKYGL